AFLDALADRLVLAHRQVDDEGRALTLGALHGDLAVVLLDDAISDGETETGAFAELLRGEEGIEDPLDESRRDARTVVGDLDPDHVAVDLAPDRELTAFLAVR